MKHYEQDLSKMKPVKLIVSGGRDFKDEARLRMTMSLYPDILFSELVCGMCPTGADKFAFDYARKSRRKVHEFPAEWDSSLGKKAGPIRNEQMAAFADVLIAFWDGKSKGTRDMIYKALKGGLEVHVYRY